MFMSAEGIILGNNFRNITRQLPVQHYHDPIMMQMAKVAEEVGQAAKMLFGSNIILNIILSGTLSLLMNLLETQQLVVLYSLINI